MTEKNNHSNMGAALETEAGAVDLGVTFVIPANLSCDGLEETIRSLREQSHQQWRCVIVLGPECAGQSRSVAEKLAAGDARLEVLVSPVGGRAELCNVAMRQAKTCWILVLQPGDTLRENFLEEIFRVVEGDSRLDAVYGETALEEEGGRCGRTGRPADDTGDLFPMFAKRPFFFLNSCVFRRSLTAYAGEFDPEFEHLEDWDFLQRVSRAGASFGVASRALVFPAASQRAVDLNRLREEGRRIILRGLAADERVKYPDPVYREGLQRSSLADGELAFGGFVDGVLLARGEAPRLMVECVRCNPGVEISFVELAEDVGAGMLLESWTNQANATEWLAKCHALFAEAARSLEIETAVPQFSFRALHALEKFLLQAGGKQSAQIGHWQKSAINLEGEINDIQCQPGIHNCLIEIEYGGTTLGQIDLPVIAGGVSSYVIEDAVVDRFAWDLLKIFFNHWVYKELRVDDFGDGGPTVFRGDVVVGSGLSDPDRTSSEFHDRIGWTLFLQELWGEPSWGEDDFYSGAGAPEDGAASATWPPAGDIYCVQVASALDNLENVASSVPVVVFVGGSVLGTVFIASKNGRVTREAFIARITSHFGVELCRAAVREGLLGRPLLDAGSLRQRLGWQSERFDPGVATFASVSDTAKFFRENYARKGLRERYAMAESQGLVPRRNHGICGMASSRRGALALGAGAGAAYAPELLDLSKSPVELTIKSLPALISVGEERTNTFELLFRAQRDPWGTANPYEAKKYEETLEMIPERPYALALDLGCAEGNFTALLARRVGRLVAADISETALQRATLTCAGQENIEFRRLDMVGDPLGGPYDLIVCSEALYFLADEEVILQVAKKIAKALTPKGLLVCAHANLVVDDPQKPGFDWDLPFGARRIGEIMVDGRGLQLVREMNTPFYRIQLFERKGPWAAVFSRSKPEMTSMSQCAALPPTVRRHALWRGGQPKRGVGRRAQTSPGLPILAYHQISDSGPPALSRYRVAPGAFEEHLRTLQAAGFYTVPLINWCWAAAVKKPLPGKPCVISFDDGYVDFETNAWPLLKKYGFSATVFLVTQQVGKDNVWDSRFGKPQPLMSWEQALRLTEEGVEFGSHSASHQPLTGLTPSEMCRETLQSRAAFEEKLKACTAFAYPYGDWDASVRHIIGASGYLCGLTCNSGFAQMQSDLLALPRILITGDDGVTEFAEKLRL